MASPRSIDSSCTSCTLTPDNCPDKDSVSVSAASTSTSVSASVSGNKFMPSDQKSCGSFFSGPSSFASASVIYGQKIGKNNAKKQRPSYIPATNDVRQRVLSARHLRFKSVQNQLGLAQLRIAELSNEVRALRTMQKRQNSALAKYESTNAELPRLLHAHAEELRVWQTKYRTLQGAHRELILKLKQKEALISTLAEENKYYNQLNQDKNLEDRQRLADKLEILQARLQERENQMKMVERRAHLEIKSYKQQLLAEQKKTKDVLQKLEKARLEMSSYRKIDDLNINEKMSNLTLKKAINPKLELKTNPLKKTFKEKPGEGKSKTSPSKTPSPILNANDNADDDSDFPISHRSQKSSTSSVNMEFTTQRSVRKMSSSTNKKLENDTTEIVGDGPDSKKILEPLQKKPHSMKQKQTKMMVNMPSFDGGAEGDTISLTNEDDDDVIVSAKSKDDDEMQNDRAYNYSDDFDDNLEDEKIEEIVKDSDINYKANRVPIDGDNENYEQEIDASQSNTKDDIINLRKQISDDYKQREAFLDTFCRQANISGLRNGDDGSNDTEPSAALRKQKLLAAIKAIDNDERCSED